MINFSDIRAAYNQKVTEYIANGFEVVQTSDGLNRNDPLLYNSTVMRNGDAIIDIVLRYRFDFELCMPSFAITVKNSDDYTVNETRFFYSSNPNVPMFYTEDDVKDWERY